MLGDCFRWDRTRPLDGSRFSAKILGPPNAATVAMPNWWTLLGVAFGFISGGAAAWIFCEVRVRNTKAWRRRQHSRLKQQQAR